MSSLRHKRSTGAQPAKTDVTIEEAAAASEREKRKRLSSHSSGNRYSVSDQKKRSVCVQRRKNLERNMAPKGSLWAAILLMMMSSWRRREERFLCSGFSPSTPMTFGGGILSSSQEKAQENCYIHFATSNDSDDFGDLDSSSSEDGASLAKDFYKELRDRQDDKSLSSSSGNEIYLNRSPVKEADTIEESKPRVKFTGARRPTSSTERSSEQRSPPEALRPGSLFSSPSSTYGGSPQTDAQSPRARMMEREMNLVNRAERNIGVQAIFAAVALSFMIYVGLTGGIQSYDANSDPGFVEDELPFEQLIPVQSDRESSVWL